MKQVLIKMFLKIFGLKRPIVGVPVIIKNEKGEILLGKRSENLGFFPGCWGLPGGMLDYNEKISDCAKRELREEMGVDVEFLRISENIYEIFESKNHPSHGVNTIVYAKIKSGTPKARDETQEVRWFSPEEILKMDLAYTHKEVLIKEGLLK